MKDNLYLRSLNKALYKRDSKYYYGRIRIHECDCEHREYDDPIEAFRDAVQDYETKIKAYENSLMNIQLNEMHEYKKGFWGATAIFASLATLLVSSLSLYIAICH